MKSSSDLAKKASQILICLGYYELTVEKKIQKTPWLLFRICLTFVKDRRSWKKKLKLTSFLKDKFGSETPEIDLDLYPQDIYPIQSIIDGPYCIKSVKSDFCQGYVLMYSPKSNF